MALIKSAAADDLAQDAIVLDLGDLRRQAKVLMDRAHAEAQRIIAEGRAEAKRLTDGADERGYAAGFARGEMEGRQAGHEAGRSEAIEQFRPQLEQIQQAWVHATTQWDADRRAMLLEARQSLLALAIEMAEQIVRRVPQVDPSIVVDQVAAAIEYVARPCDVTVRIHPDNHKLLEDAMPQLIDQLGGVDHASLADDPAITPGGCIVTYGQGRIDATLEKQLERLVEALLPGKGSEVGVQGSVKNQTPPSEMGPLSNTDAPPNTPQSPEENPEP